MKPAGRVPFLAPRGRKATLSVLTFLFMLLLGILSASQIRSLAEERLRLASTRRDFDYYSRMIATEEDYLAVMQQKVDDLSTRKESLLESMLEGAGDFAVLEQLKKARTVAGFTPLLGRGIIVTLDDSILRGPDTDPTASIIHDGDVRHVVDLLRSSGAFAVSINGQRIVSTSELICNGPTILINGSKYPVPYRISAIGDAQALAAAIVSDEYLGYRRAEGIIVLTETSEEVEIPAFDRADSVDGYIDALEVKTP